MVGSRILIVGGGIAGLACAWELSHSLPDATITLVDAGDRPGGKLRREPVAGVALDVGAESMLARRPEALDLVTELGLDLDVVHPATTSAAIWSRGDLHPLPKGTLMGIPSPAASALGILTADEVSRAESETPWDAGDFEDVSVGDYVAARLGDAVVDRLVEPLLGGVYAGQARLLSLRACLPQVFAAARRGESLTDAAAAAAAAAASAAATSAGAAMGATAPAAGDASASATPPVFAGLDGGVGRLAEVLAESLRGRGVTVRSGTIARELHREPAGSGGGSGGGWSVVVGPQPRPERIHADAVVLATPAASTAKLLAPHVPDATRALREVDYASMAIITLAVGADGPTRAPLPGSGFLVPALEGRTIKASTFSSTKWGWTADAAQDLSFLRASVGRYGETSDLQRPDEELVAIAVAEVSEALGHQLPRIVDAHVQRWGGALPQYTVGHVDRIARIRAALATAPGLALAGAAYDGVGIPACVASGRSAARAVATHLRSRQGGEGD
ncbi:oxygen-dependent protoporphyrinogen oxidase [Pedococcus dokdonensis]|uniref:Coproporphyrinogen III oxidase n=1 Tax=Pedococcus dokdonensis TaxID=443156 RepID=A0A1H0N5S7_9MICO|nr:protoporphyrinogen oxidase [Pedococcus dokdonensis]SDO87988.1 oxygen-dependent protoporphyrinogen oxidase [Pedococcus dokdonensis]